MDEVDLLLDTDVLVDLLRRFPPAVRWAKDHASARLGIPVVVYLELLQGARHQADLDALCRYLTPYPVFHLESGDSTRALECFKEHRLSRGIGILDCLIAALVSRLGKPLCTFNTRHYGAIPHLLLQVPYSRDTEA